MADGFQSVALDIKPPDPNQAFQSIGNILGLQQKKQALGIQAQELAQQQIATDQAQNFQTFTQKFDPASHIGADGTLDVAGVRNSAAYKNAGNAKPLVDEYIQKVQTGQLGAKQALQTLDSGTLTQMTQGIGALANDKDVLADNAAGREKVANYYKSFGQQSPEAARISGLYSGVVQHAKQGDLSDAIYAQQLMGADVLGQRSQQNPVRGTNAAGQATIANPRSGLTALAPTTGGGDVNPPSTKVAAQTTSGTGQASADNQRVSDISNSVAPSRAVISLTQQLDNYVDQAKTGKFSKAVTDYAAAAGIKDPAIAARQLASKTAAQIRAQATQNAPTNEARETISAGSPDPDTMNADAIHKANELVRGNMRLNLARDANAARFQQTHGGTQGLRMADDQLTKNADGLMYEYQSLPKGPQRTAFIQRHFASPAEAQDFVHRKNLVEHNGGFNQ